VDGIWTTKGAKSREKHESARDADLCFSYPLCYNRGCRDRGDHLRVSNTSQTGGQENQPERARWTDQDRSPYLRPV